MDLGFEFEVAIGGAGGGAGGGGVAVAGSFLFGRRGGAGAAGGGGCGAGSLGDRLRGFGRHQLGERRPSGWRSGGIGSFWISGHGRGFYQTQGSMRSCWGWEDWVTEVCEKVATLPLGSRIRRLAPKQQLRTVRQDFVEAGEPKRENEDGGMMLEQGAFSGRESANLGLPW